MEFDYGRHVFRAPELQSIVDRAVEFFSNTIVYEFPPPFRMNGADVYGLYYLGDYEPYASLVDTNKVDCSKPIYIGKAVLPGNRTGLNGEYTSLFVRLRQHSRSVKATDNLKVEDFRCRFIFLNDIEHDLIGAVETGLIKSLRLLWNSRVVEGFGNHDPGKGRYKQQPSAWDTLHPGRTWARSLTGEPRDLDVIKVEIKRFLEAPKLADMLDPSDNHPLEISHPPLFP